MSTGVHSAEEIAQEALKTSFCETTPLTSAELYEWYWNENSMLFLFETVSPRVVPKTVKVYSLINFH